MSSSSAQNPGKQPARTRSRGQSDAAVAKRLGPYLPSRAMRGRTTDAVTDALREAILDGALTPSSWLREDELAEVFSVSRTPVREALRLLSDEGLAVKTIHQGTIVAPLSLEDILALYVVRENLEGLAARLATGRAPNELVKELEAVQEQMRVTAERGQVDRLAQQNLLFHRAIRDAAGNSYLERFLNQVEQAVRRLPGSTFTQPGRPEETLVEHQAIIDAVKAGDREEAANAAHQHMRRAREIRLSVLIGS